MAIQNSNTSLLNDKMVDMKFITEFSGLTDKWFYKLISEGQFPKPIKLGRSSRWMQSEVENWVKQRINQSRSE
ncbi:helix-turn-helix transcriptional regulator [Klebsiella pneumoniae]|uniref:helix-turn-helix transcriptional regulator n=1 Tax=Klebsiella pneumoniae TaxID=573 RepID=UPI00164B55F7|nr:AlpA family phage regulatory protein [Klebsiella pneumoniae]MBC5197566.1 AlpA family phage regulatory protein [Klebsiella pneumoniae]UYH26593.1 AlpA family phage regulatory protein [Klebsiella pneumoniae]HBR1377853.1 AlpA family phage regulatory protein [Klebsiella quasipneumoniae subsp. similipneumoniae]